MADSQPARLVLHVGVASGPDMHASAVRALNDISGVRSVTPDLYAGTLQVDFDPALTSVSALVGCLAGHGMPPSRARLVDDDSAATPS